jgi:hypothetical protein
MAKEEKPVGKPYDQVYLERDKPADDSTRLRRRLAAFIDSCPRGLRENAAFEVNLEVLCL